MITCPEFCLHSSALFCALLHASALFCTLLHASARFCTLQRAPPCPRLQAVGKDFSFSPFSLARFSAASRNGFSHPSRLCFLVALSKCAPKDRKTRKRNRLETVDCRLQTTDSRLQPQAPGLRLQAASLGPQASRLRTQDSGLQPQVSRLQPPVSCLRRRPAPLIAHLKRPSDLAVAQSQGTLMSKLPYSLHASK
jgi:hypothetical protein